MPKDTYDVIVVGGGPAGLSAAEHAAAAGASVLVIEQNKEIGSPTRTSGGSFIRDLTSLGIPEALYHPIRRGRMRSPHHEVVFDYAQPAICVIDVRGVFQFLAHRAIERGAEVRVGTTFTDVLQHAGRTVGIRARDLRGHDLVLQARVVADATGYRALVSKRAGFDPGFQRFGVGAEYDLYAPKYDQSEAVLIVGSDIAPAGYAWAFPWGGGRVRVGVGIIHADSTARPELYLDHLIAGAAGYGMNLDGAQPLEYHVGLIPSDGLSARFAADGLLAVGDAAGQASTLVGEGIRWAIRAGQLAGQIAAQAALGGDASAAFLSTYERRWRNEHGANLRIAHEINRRIASWTDQQWDRGIDLLKALSPAQFAEALQSNFMGPWLISAVATNPKLIRSGASAIIRGLLASS